MPFSLGGPELFIILAIVLIVFGAGKLPNAFRDMGRGVKEFKKAQAEEEAALASTAAETASAPVSMPGMPAAMASSSAGQWTGGAPVAPARNTEVAAQP